MSDQFNVTAAMDKASYNAGDTMKVTISGSDVLTTMVTTPVTGTVNFVAADGATGSGAFSGSIASPTTTPESVKIASVTDAGGRTWVVDASGLFATAVA